MVVGSSNELSANVHSQLLPPLPYVEPADGKPHCCALALCLLLSMRAPPLPYVETADGQPPCSALALCRLLSMHAAAEPAAPFNKGILVNDTNFIIEINTINHFLKNHAQPLNNYYFETEGVLYSIAEVWIFLYHFVFHTNNCA